MARQLDGFVPVIIERLHDFNQAVECDRFGDERVDAQIVGAQNMSSSALEVVSMMTGMRRSCGSFFNSLQHFAPVFARHIEVEQNQVGARRAFMLSASLHKRPCVSDIASLLRRRARKSATLTKLLSANRFARQKTIVFVVVGQQYGERLRRIVIHISGKLSLKERKLRDFRVAYSNTLVSL